MYLYIQFYIAYVVCIYMFRSHRDRDSMVVGFPTNFAKVVSLKPTHSEE
jgi:hypothetical protein